MKVRNRNSTKNTVELQWHNIIENPLDLPEEDDTLITTIETKNGHRYVATTVFYDSDEDLWIIEDHLEYALNVIMEFQLPKDSAYFFDEDYGSDKVIAWAYLPEPYVG